MVDEESQPAQPATELLCDLCRRKGDPEHFIRMLCPGCLNGCAGLNPTAYRECVAALRALTTAILKDVEQEDAHLREKYSISIPSLISVWHTLIKPSSTR